MTDKKSPALRPYAIKNSEGETIAAVGAPNAGAALLFYLKDRFTVKSMNGSELVEWADKGNKMLKTE